MKSKLLSFLIALVMILTLVPATLLASGDDSGSDLDNAYPVDDFSKLLTALDDPTITVIELTAPVNVNSTINIPTGKTLIIRADGVHPVMLSSRSINVQSGATLINESGISLVGDSAVNVLGVFLNYGQIYQSKIKVQTGGSFTNKAGAAVDEVSILHVYGGSVVNEGNISCSVYKVGAGVVCTISGVPESQIGTTNAPISYTTITYSPITMPASDTKTLGLPGEDAVLVDDPDGYEVFAKGYLLSLEAGQTVVIQTETDFLPYMYFMKAGFTRLHAPNLTGVRYTVEATGNYYFLIAGYDSYRTGTFTITIYEPDENLVLPMDFTLDSTDPSFPGTSGAGWTWDGTTKTLTLNGIKISNDSSLQNTAIALPADAQLVLQAGSENFIQSTNSAISCDGNLTVSGSGALTINSGNCGIEADGLLTMSCSGTLHVNAFLLGLVSPKGITLNGCSDLTIFAHDSGAISGGEIRIANSTANIFGWNFGILTTVMGQMDNGGDVIIENSDVYASCDSASGRGAIFAGDDLDSSVTEGHSKIILDHTKLTSPQGSSIANVDFSELYMNCQTVTTQAGLETVTSFSQMAKSVRFRPAYDVLYAANGGTGTLTDTNNSYVKSASVSVLANTFTRSSYVFTGWNTAADGSGTSYDPADTFSVVSGVTLYAQWAAQHTVRFVNWNGTVLSTQSVAHGAAAVAPANPTRSGYHFTGWNVSFASITADITVTAVFGADVARTGETGGSDIAPILLLSTGITALGALVVLKKKEQQGI